MTGMYEVGNEGVWDGNWDNSVSDQTPVGIKLGHGHPLLLFEVLDFAFFWRRVFGSMFLFKVESCIKDIIAVVKQAVIIIIIINGGHGIEE